MKRRERDPDRGYIVAEALRVDRTAEVAERSAEIRQRFETQMRAAGLRPGDAP